MNFRLFGCRHSSLSFPQKRAGVVTQSCLQCGSEFEYDWERMERSPHRRAVAPVEEQSAAAPTSRRVLNPLEVSVSQASRAHPGRAEDVPGQLARGPVRPGIFPRSL